MKLSEEQWKKIEKFMDVTDPIISILTFIAIVVLIISVANLILTPMGTNWW